MSFNLNTIYQKFWQEYSYFSRYVQEEYQDQPVTDYFDQKSRPVNPGEISMIQKTFEKDYLTAIQFGSCLSKYIRTKDYMDFNEFLQEIGDLVKNQLYEANFEYSKHHIDRTKRLFNHNTVMILKVLLTNVSSSQILIL